MAYVNEYIPAEDIDKYGIKEIDTTYFRGGSTKARDWTIDRGRQMYLRNVGLGRDEIHHITQWTFLWHGQLLLIEIHYKETKGQRGGPCWTRMAVTSMRAFDPKQPLPLREQPLPPELKARRDEILADLKEALVAYKDGGVFATCTDYTLTLDVEITE